MDSGPKGGHAQQVLDRTVALAEASSIDAALRRGGRRRMAGATWLASQVLEVTYALRASDAAKRLIRPLAEEAALAWVRSIGPAHAEAAAAWLDHDLPAGLLWAVEMAARADTLARRGSTRFSARSAAELITGLRPANVASGASLRRNRGLTRCLGEASGGPGYVARYRELAHAVRLDTSAVWRQLVGEGEPRLKMAARDGLGHWDWTSQTVEIGVRDFTAARMAADHPVPGGRHARLAWLIDPCQDAYRMAMTRAAQSAGSAIPLTPGFTIVHEVMHASDEVLIGPWTDTPAGSQAAAGVIGFTLIQAVRQGPGGAIRLIPSGLIPDQLHEGWTHARTAIAGPALIAAMSPLVRDWAYDWSVPTVTRHPYDRPALMLRLLFRDAEIMDLAAGGDGLELIIGRLAARLGPRRTARAAAFLHGDAGADSWAGIIAAL